MKIKKSYINLKKKKERLILLDRRCQHLDKISLQRENLKREGSQIQNDEVKKAIPSILETFGTKVFYKSACFTNHM
jgi:hypothetical protein